MSHFIPKGHPHDPQDDLESKLSNIKCVLSFPAAWWHLTFDEVACASTINGDSSAEVSHSLQLIDSLILSCFWEKSTYATHFG